MILIDDVYADPVMSVTVQWPDGTYSLPKPARECPGSGWSTGSRHQDNEDSNNANSYTPSNFKNYMKIDLGRNIKTYYCTKTFGGNSGFVWPKGNYCIARRGGNCPSGFKTGSIYWDDEDDGNANSFEAPLPDGTYNTNTLVEFCCRNDESAVKEIILPPTKPFILYRHNRICQRIKGMNNAVPLWLKTDDEDSSNRNNCSGDHPDANCGGNHELFFCYYSPR